MTITDTSRTGPPAAPRRPLPQGAAKWSKTYLNAKHMPERSEREVPVDVNDYRTPHVRMACPKRVSDEPCPQEVWAEPGEQWHCTIHGDRLVADEDARPSLLPWGAMWKATEPSARPIWLLAAEAAAGIVVEAEHIPPTMAMLAAAGVPVVAYRGAKWWLTRRAVKRGKLDEGQESGRRVETIARRARAAGYIGTAAAAWLSAAALVDPHSLAGRAVWASLPVVWALGALPWWRYLEAQRNRPEPVEAVPAPAEPGMPTDDERAAAEAAAVWAGDTRFQGSRLDTATWRRTIAGWQTVIVATKPGGVTGLGGDSVPRTVRAVADAYNVPKSAITWIEEWEDSPRMALLLVQPNNPLKEPQIWAGPESIDMGKGTAAAGRLIDGSPLLEVLYRKGHGAPNRVTLGTTGSGKSERVRKRLVTERWAYYVDPQTGQKRGAFISILHDPKEMDSYGEFTGALHAYGITRDDGHLIVDALLRECQRRYQYKRNITWHDKRGRLRSGSMPWDPAAHGPIISSFWDEFHELAGDKEFVAKLEKLARKQRAAGMTFELDSHGGVLSDMGSQILRDMGASGITTLFRTKTALNAALVAGGVTVGDPRTLPTEPGMCYVVDGQTKSTMMARGSWIPWDEDEHDITLYDWLYDADNQPIGYPAEIPPETAAAFGREFMEWAEAGKRPGGRDAKAEPGAAPLPVVDAAKAEETLRRIMFEAGGPVSRDEIRAHPSWRWAGPGTLTSALRKGQDANPPWAVRLTGDGKGVRFDLTPSAREEMTAAEDEEKEPAE